MKSIGALNGVEFHNLMRFGKSDLPRAVRDAIAPGAAESSWPGSTCKVLVQETTHALLEYHRPGHPSGNEIARHLYVAEG